MEDEDVQCYKSSDKEDDFIGDKLNDYHTSLGCWMHMTWFYHTSLGCWIAYYNMILYWLDLCLYCKRVLNFLSLYA